MPSNLTSSFASAAAGQNATRDSRSGRTDGRGAAGADWSRRDGRSANGTLTFRRSSTTPLGQPLPPLSSADNAVQSPSVETPIAQPSSYDVDPSRYTREELLDVFRAQKGGEDPSRLFIPGWNPGHVNGNSARGWGKPNDNHVPQEPGACWDENGDSTPVGLQQFSAEEKDTFSTEINSPLKPPTLSKEGHPGNVNGRKASLSQGSGAPFGVTSPSSATRPGTRRRETLESNPFSAGGLSSPTAPGRFSRDDPSYWFPRKNSEMKEPETEDQPEPEQGRDTSSKLPFGNLMRSNTAGSAGGGSIWPPSSQTTPGVGGFGNFAMPGSNTVGDKRVGGPTGGSQLAHLMPKESTDSLGGKQGDSPNPLNQQSWRSRPRTDTDPYGDDGLSGSAVLGGAQDSGGPQQSGRVGTLGTPVKSSTGDFGMSGLNPSGQVDDDGPVSPSETNPYRSPPTERRNHEEGDPTTSERPHEQPSNFSTLSRGFGAAAFEGSDRSQTSSVGGKSYPMGGISGWPIPGVPSAGTPDRERPNFGNAFGNSLFNPMGELQSPGVSNLSNAFGPTSAGGIGAGSIGRGSKLGSLFPPAMQAQMQQAHEHDNLNDSVPDLRQSNPLGAIGRSNIPGPTRETDSPMRTNRGVFDELFPLSEAGRQHSVFSTAEAGQQAATGTAPQSFTPVSSGVPFAAGPPGVEAPTSQVRVMVMPDRMWWVYLDPQGQIQGPFTGLEMNDWYKANFFTPDLRVKKVEDQEFEPLGQLIRRIGNSREPFLVPQIGIAHGPPTQSGPFSPANTSGVLPPLSGVFPSFGRTLTAEEQNNLERRKQEEQYIMAQQREFVMRQQAMSKFQMGGPGLQHHSSAHSLQSQPSFGSITSPIGQQQPQPIGAMGPPTGFFDAAVAAQGSGQMGPGNGDHFRDDDLVHLSATERQVLANLQGGGGAAQHMGPPMGDGSLRTGLPETEQLRDDSEGFRDRLQEFEELRAQHDAELSARVESMMAGTEGLDIHGGMPESVEQLAEASGPSGKAAMEARRRAVEEAEMSLTQQVQHAQAAAAAVEPAEPGMPMPFPPPQSSTPLPAPTAQRVRSNLPEQYSRSASGTPDMNPTQPPPLAPWAKDPGVEGHRGPSLKEIQESEARKAAKVEEAAAALRKATLEQEAVILREKEKAAAAAAGLPATSTWAHGSPVSATTPWAKPGPVKGPAPPPSTASASSKKTLADIQREEELRKQKIALQTGVPVVVSKSYANLAGKPNAPPSAPSPGGAGSGASAAGWSTVGAGGKVKIPTGPATQGRSASAAAVKAVAAVAAAATIKPMSRPAAANGKADSGNAAMDEFNKWVAGQLSRGITSVDSATFQSMLLVLPLDTSIIADAVYANSTTMDGRHFAEEFVRRKRLAEKGVFEKQPAADGKGGGSSGGWNEVAKKGGSSGAAQPKDDAAVQGAGFKVVPGRKKGKK